MENAIKKPLKGAHEPQINTSTTCKHSHDPMSDSSYFRVDEKDLMICEGCGEELGFL